METDRRLCPAEMLCYIVAVFNVYSVSVYSVSVYSVSVYSISV